MKDMEDMEYMTLSSYGIHNLTQKEVELERAVLFEIIIFEFSSFQKSESWKISQIWYK